MPKISVIVPVYNVEKYMRKSIDSILGQTFKDMEILLVDDGSTDNSGKICDEYKEKDPRVQVIHKKNGGQSTARNAGVNRASGEYIGFIDGDDYIAPNMYEKLLDMIEAAQADVAVCGIYDVYQNTKTPQCAEKAEFVCDAKEMFRNILIDDKVSGSTCNRLIRAEIAKKLRFLDGKLFEDAFYSTQLVKNVEKAAVTTEPLYYYVHRTDSTTTSKFRKADLDVIEAFAGDAKLVKERFPELKKEAKFALDSAYLRVLDKMLLTKGYRNIPEYKKIVQYLKKNSKDIIKCPYFLRTRRLAMRAFRIHVLLYRAMLLLNENVNRRQL